MNLLLVFIIALLGGFTGGLFAYMVVSFVAQANFRQADFGKVAAVVVVALLVIGSAALVSQKERVAKSLAQQGITLCLVETIGDGGGCWP